MYQEENIQVIYKDGSTKHFKKVTQYESGFKELIGVLVVIVISTLTLHWIFSKDSCKVPLRTDYQSQQK